ncbi:hypothetical protein K488DRAFT_82368 [Vararia minispora EC-137]|uniref:Uncharacterized protein n=1 Tax=Vararia minispora EC-137 TaxID=1314806 RepID=A0ACB8QW55_9AGAM|nr:hypothetical protein K488DRAFT_82368 [Vararia minispora EC-137]
MPTRRRHSWDGGNLPLVAPVGEVEPTSPSSCEETVTPNTPPLTPPLGYPPPPVGSPGQRRRSRRPNVDRSSTSKQQQLSRGNSSQFDGNAGKSAPGQAGHSRGPRMNGRQQDWPAFGYSWSLNYPPPAYIPPAPFPAPPLAPVHSPFYQHQSLAYGQHPAFVYPTTYNNPPVFGRQSQGHVPAPVGAATGRWPSYVHFPGMPGGNAPFPHNTGRWNPGQGSWQPHYGPYQG